MVSSSNIRVSRSNISVSRSNIIVSIRKNTVRVTINKLMEIAQAGTVDPTSSIYNTTMYLMAAILFVALVMNATMRPVDAKHHMKE